MQNHNQDKKIESSYRNIISENIKESISSLKTRPVLFIGSGLSMRYFDAPTWYGLLTKIAEELNERIAKIYQDEDKDLIKCASILANIAHTKVWDGSVDIPEDHEDTVFKNNKEDYVKYMVCRYIESITPKDTSGVNQDYINEINLLSKTKPHAIITTNYDSFLENVVFCDYEKIIGEDIFDKTNFMSNIYKIHGCSKQHQSIILTSGDFEDYNIQNRYISAKLFTLFVEHPVFFLGYSVNDPNIREILNDVNQMMSKNKSKFLHTYIVNYDDEPTRPEVKSIENINLNSISTKDFTWLYEAISSQAPHDLDVRTLRLFQEKLSRLTISGIPSGETVAKYATLRSYLNDDDTLRNIIGIDVFDGTNDPSKSHPHNTTEVSRILDIGSNWHPTVKLLDEIKNIYGIDIKITCNIYHTFRYKNGKPTDHYYSDELVELLRLHIQGESLEFDSSVKL